MTRRPNVFSQEEFQTSLRRLGCHESFVAPITSDFRLFVPIIISRLGEARMLELVEEARGELGLGPQEPAWREAAKYIVGWAEESIDRYRRERTTENGGGS